MTRRCETLRARYGMGDDDTAEDVLAERLCVMVGEVITAVLRDDVDLPRTRNDAAVDMAAEATAILVPDPVGDLLAAVDPEFVVGFVQAAAAHGAKGDGWQFTRDAARTAGAAIWAHVTIVVGDDAVAPWMAAHPAVEQLHTARRAVRWDPAECAAVRDALAARSTP